MKTALFLPIFDALSDPSVVVELAVEAEATGWDGVFVWDHISYRPPVQAVADPWITMAAIASATSRIRIGPMVTPLPRRRPVVVARQVTTLDHLSGGRVVFGVGLGSDGAGELTATGEELDDRVRGDMLDEGLAVLCAAWTGDVVHHRGEHYALDGVSFLPTPVQVGGPPVWVAARFGNRRPLRRAASYDGIFPIEVERPEQLAEVVADVTELRGGDMSSYDVVVGGPPGTDPAPFEAAGATWWTVSFSPYDITVDQVRGVLREGPYSSG